MNIDPSEKSKYNTTKLPPGGIRRGKHTFITREQPLLKEVCAEFGRDVNQTCVKVFYGNPLKDGEKLRDALWGDHPRQRNDPRKNTTVFAGSQVQNILWRHGICPRVYAIFEADFKGERVVCQLTDFVEGKHAEHVGVCRKMKLRIDEIGKDYGFASQTSKFGQKDIVGGLCVDPQLWAFDIKPYKDIVKEIYFEKGRYGKVYYQNDERLDSMGGPRQSVERVRYMKLDEIDFKGKTVWDVGCAGAYFCRYAIDRGARRVIGFDKKEPLEAAFHAGNLLGYFNIDYVECDLKRGIPVDGIPKADIGLFLSMNLHVGNLEQLKEVPLVIFEDNGKESRKREVLGKPWTDWYSKIEFVGRAKDHGGKALYLLRK